jgi:hypothetical protein
MSACENSAPRRIFGPNRGEVAGGWRRLHNVERRNLCTSPNILMVIKSRRMRRVGHIVRMGELITYLLTH